MEPLTSKRVKIWLMLIVTLCSWPAQDTPCVHPWAGHIECIKFILNWLVCLCLLIVRYFLVLLVRKISLHVYDAYFLFVDTLMSNLNTLLFDVKIVKSDRSDSVRESINVASLLPQYVNERKIRHDPNRELEKNYGYTVRVQLPNSIYRLQQMIAILN